MKILQLTTIVRDVQTATMHAQTFTRSPVLVGRQFGNQLRLDARMVSRRHGAFLFSKDGLQFIDYNSANGTFIDGIRVQPNVPFDLRASSIITIAPFQIVAHVDLVDSGRLANDPNASTPPPVAVLRPPPITPEAHSWRAIMDDETAMRRASSWREAIELADRATRVIEAVAEALLAAGSRTATVSSPLRLATSPGEMAALLLDASDGAQRLAELRELLAELLRRRLSSVP